MLILLSTFYFSGACIWKKRDTFDLQLEISAGAHLKSIAWFVRESCPAFQYEKHGRNTIFAEDDDMMS